MTLRFRVQDLSFRFANDRRLTVEMMPGGAGGDGWVPLDAIGNRLAIMGPNACGKTTLLHALSAMRMPQSGSVEWRLPAADRPWVWAPPEISRSDWQHWHALRQRHFGFVFQRSTLLPFLTAVENVAYALSIRDGTSPRAARDDAWARLHTAFKDTKDRPEDVGRSYPHELSGGQQQLVALTQAMAGGRSVLFADEPTSNLDATVRRHVIAIVHEWLEGSPQTRAFIWITHREDELALVGATHCLRLTPQRRGDAVSAAICDLVAVRAAA